MRVERVTKRKVKERVGKMTKGEWLESQGESKGVWEILTAEGDVSKGGGMEGGRVGGVTRREGRVKGRNGAVQKSERRMSKRE